MYNASNEKAIQAISRSASREVSKLKESVDRRSLLYRLVLLMHTNPMWGAPEDMHNDYPAWLRRRRRSLFWWRMQEAKACVIFIPTVILYFWPGMMIMYLVHRKGWDYPRTHGWLSCSLAWIAGVNPLSYWVGHAELSSVGQSLVAVFWLANFILLCITSLAVGYVLINDAWDKLNEKDVTFIN